MRIGIDARFLTHPQYGGFKTYTVGLITALAALGGNDTLILYVDRPPASAAAAVPLPHSHLRVVSGKLPLLGMPWREQWALPRAIARDRLDVFHAPALTAPLRVSCPLVVTIHDTIWLRQRSGRAPRRRLLDGYQRTVGLQAAQRATAVLAVSHAAKAEIVADLGLPAERVTVTYEAAGPLFRPASSGEVERVRRRYGLPTRFILMQASADPRKNFRGALAAYAALPDDVRSTCALTVLWAHAAPEKTASPDAAPSGGAIHSLRQIDDADLAPLYSAASLLLFPSLAEGFGLPVLEAMACGTPVVAGDHPSIREVAGDAAVLAPATDAAALAEAVARVLRDDALRGALIDAGLRRAGSFSWERCAAQTLDVYKRAAGHGARVNSREHSRQG